MKNKVMAGTFLWMFVGLLVTFITGYVVSINENMFNNIFSDWSYIILIILELVLVIFLSARVFKMSKTMARISFLVYSFVSGLTFGSVFVVYKLTSIMLIFGVAALVFLVFALLGYYTKLDLTKLGTYLYMVLFASIICIIVNLFINNSVFDTVLSVIILIIFMGITAYDVQKVKSLSDSNLPEDNLMIYGALELYLDYINIFLHLLELFGREN